MWIKPTDGHARGTGINDTCLVPLRTLMDIDTVVMRNIPATRSITAESSKEKVRKRKTREPYRRYTANQIEQLFDYVIEQGKTSKLPALLTRINTRTAQHYVKKYNDVDERTTFADKW
jgi:hypothetical protein